MKKIMFDNLLYNVELLMNYISYKLIKYCDILFISILILFVNFSK